MANRGKKQFKNPFDLDDDEETIPMQSSFHEEERPVHKPLPFNPYNVSESPPKKAVQVNEKLKSSPSQATQKSSEAVGFNPVERPTSQQENEYKPEKTYELNEDGDPPLLEDIGIEPEIIVKRMKLILKLGKPDEEMIEDPDLSGPILIALCFGLLLLLSGKVQFGDIYAIFVVGNFLLYFLFNFMSQVEILSLYTIMSTVGYALIPMLILGLFGIFTTLKGNAGILLSLAVSGWSSLAASNFIEALMKQTQSNRKLLLIYPLFLFYMSFAMIIIF